ncbi:MAG: endonuclease/exonuclease/phosphatase family protein, partial [Saprospiraceae bacterium]|nr:endonuclease/exonuclease/phosphatase family protein [Saprospiraceae bacterium]
MKQALQVLWVVVCCAPLMGQSIEDLSFGTDSTLEVMTWNIERFPKDGFTTIEHVADIIEALDADLIALQEIDDQQSFDAILNLLGDRAGYWDDDALSGLAYIYNPDVIEVLDIFQIYQGESRPFPRAPLVMHCIYEGEFLVVINNNLKSCGN